MAAGHLSLSHGVGTIYWVGSMQAARVPSLGLAISRALTNAAFRRGAGARTLPPWLNRCTVRSDTDSSSII
jgi:hypothetical protein